MRQRILARFLTGLGPERKPQAMAPGKVTLLERGLCAIGGGQRQVEHRQQF